MIKQTFTLILLIFVISLAQSASDIEQVFKGICDLRAKQIQEGTFDKIIKASSDCREKVLTKDELAAIAKCDRILPLNEADQVIETCGDFNGNKDKFDEVIQLFNARNYLFQLIECKEKAVGSVGVKYFVSKHSFISLTNEKCERLDFEYRLIKHYHR
uniref:DUF19 domain-containing protein n=1 Tax=Tetranychus urticae TaxID=32264 RepID=T1JYE2_TETUR